MENNTYTFIFDIDGTICPIKTKDMKYEDIVPNFEMIKKIKDYKKYGAKIVLFTSRNMNSYNGNLGLINKNTAKILLNWLEKWQIPFDELIYGKPWPGFKGFYIDDRAVRPNEFLDKPLDELEIICKNSQVKNKDENQKNLDIVITMAGSGSRFSEAGYSIPKFMIEAKGRTLFEWSLTSLKNLKPIINTYIFVVREDTNSKEFIISKCKDLGISNIKIVEIKEKTDGQATTGLLAIPFCSENSGILFFNIDTFIEPSSLSIYDIKGEGFIPCFYADGDHWSFVKTDAQGKAIEVKEKTRISNNCSLGLYYFSSPNLYQTIYNEFYGDPKNLTKNEKYIAPMYNLMIKKGLPVYINIIDSESVHVLGTPEELEAFKATYNGERNEKVNTSGI